MIHFLFVILSDLYIDFNWLCVRNSFGKFSKWQFCPLLNCDQIFISKLKKCFLSNQQDNWEFITMHQISLMIAFMIFVLHIILTLIAALSNRENQFILYFCQWLEFDKKELTASTICKMLVSLAIFAGSHHLFQIEWILWVSLNCSFVSALSGYATYSLHIYMKCCPIFHITTDDNTIEDYWQSQMVAEKYHLIIRI